MRHQTLVENRAPTAVGNQRLPNVSVQTKLRQTGIPVPNNVGKPIQDAIPHTLGETYSYDKKLAGIVNPHLPKKYQVAQFENNPFGKKIGSIIE